MRTLTKILTLLSVTLFTQLPPVSGQEKDSPKKKIVFIAGNPSHGYGSHEHYAGCRVLARTIQERGFHVDCEVVARGWPQDESILNSADTIVIYADGGGGHPALPHLKSLGKLMDKGVGLVCLHYAVEVPKDRGGPEFLQWLGGYFETDWSVNPHWTAQYSSLPMHPITNEVKPFSANDEWYFHMRFAEDRSRLQPILTALPPESTMSRADGPHSGNPHVRKAIAKQEPQHMAWAFERPNGGRSFGFTGGHYHWNWGRPEIAQLVSNAIVWTAGIDPSSTKETSKPTSVAELAKDQDEPAPQSFNPRSIQQEFAIPLETSDKAGQAVAIQSSSNKTSSAKPAYQSPLINSQFPSQQVEISVPLQDAKKLFLVVTDGGDSYSCDWADWINPVLINEKGEKTSLTELKWKRATSDWGEVNRNRNTAGGPLMIRNQTYDKGIGTHASSFIEYDIPAGMKTFEAIGGLDLGGTSQNNGGGTSVQFVVYLDTLPEGATKTSSGPNQQREPENAVAGLDAHTGVQIQLAASEPTLKSLTNIDIDHRGRVWACEVVNYRGHRNDRPEGDRIVILEDVDHDGVMDTSKLFYQGRDVDSALGICVLGNRILVSAAPNVIEFIDENGDDVPDQKRNVFTKTGDAQHDHSVHSFIIGPDNRLYFNFGNTGHMLGDAEGKTFVDPWGRAINDSGKPYRQGMAFRCKQDFSNMEVIGHNFRNNYELTVDSFGTVWQSDNDDDGNRATRINFVMEYGNYGYTDEKTGDSWPKARTNIEAEIPLQHWHLNDPGVVPTMLITGAGSPTGIASYEGKLLPKEFHNQVIHCDAGPNVVRAYPTKNDGAGYSAEILNLVEGSRDKWFRPADVCVAPDGSLFISDWYDPGVGGHLMGDTERGRLFRIAPPNTTYKVPSYDFSTAQGAVAALQSPAQSVRFLAMQSIEKMGKAAEAELVKLYNSDDPRLAARALWMLSKLQNGSAHIQKAMKHENADLRITAIRTARASKLDRKLFIDPMLNDSSPQVRRELCVALREDDSTEMPQRWAKLADQYDGKDRWMLEALGIAAMDRWDECLDEYLKTHKVEASNPAVFNIIWRSRAQKTSELIAEILSSGDVQPAMIEPLFRSLDFQNDESKAKAIEKLLELAATR